MKKLIPALCLLLLLTVCLAPLGCAAENYDTLADWDIKIHVPDGTTAVLDGNAYYIYPEKSGYLPYVMLNSYRYSSLELFLSDFVEYMAGQYSDIRLLSEPCAVSIGGKQGAELDFSYTVSGYEVRDRRVVLYENARAYVFCSKEVPALEQSVGSLLEDVIADCVLLGVSEAAPQDAPEAPAYLYCLDNGMPKYWLDLSGTMADDPVLHCYFRSGDPSFYESCFILDLDTAETDGGVYTFRNVTDMRGFDVSNRFERLAFDGGSLTLSVKRDEKTLAGGAEDNILTGDYPMEPVGLGMVYEYRQDDGMLKYWLDTRDGVLTLHAMFRSGDPEFYEARFTLDSESAEADGEYLIKFNRVFNEAGYEVSEWFKSLTLTEVQGALMLNVKRDERTLAGGADDNILTGVYLFEPRTYLLPLGDAPYSAGELARWGQLYYFRETGFYPPEADAVANADGSFTVHLYEIVEIDDCNSRTATSAWYTVGADGRGYDDLSGKPVALCG